MNLSIKKTNAIIALIVAVSLLNSAYSEEAQNNGLGRFVKNSVYTESKLCPNGNTETQTTNTDHYTCGTVSTYSMTDCAGNTTTSLPDTNYKGVNIDGGTNNDFFVAEGGYLCTDGDLHGDNFDGFFRRRAVNAGVNKDRYAKMFAGDFGTDDLNIRIFEIVDGKVEVVLDTVVYAPVSHRISLEGYNINDNYYVSASRGLGFTPTKNIERNDKNYDIIADYNYKNSKKATRESNTKKYRSCLLVSKLNNLRKEEAKPAVEEEFDIDEAVNVYPNPSHGEVNINVKTGLSGLLKVYYVNHGSNEKELVHTIRLESGVTSYKIDSSVLAKKGTYIVVGEVDYKDIAHAIEPIPFMIVK